MQSVTTKIFIALAAAIAAAAVLFYVGVALVYIALVCGVVAIAALLVLGIGRGITGRRLPGSGH